MAARYWAVLFENLRRAVDDLYRTCEGDESCIAAREVVMTLGNYTKEFSDLINWLKLKTEYENTPGPQRPTSLAWDIRKTSPLGKGAPRQTTPCSTPGKLTPTRHLLLASPAKRQLNFEAEVKDAVAGCRSRTVSETIKEVGLEADFSPHASSCTLTKEEEEEEGVSEHEKSDSEQEKDITPVNEAVNEASETVEETAVSQEDAEADKKDVVDDQTKPIESKAKKPEEAAPAAQTRNRKSRVRMERSKGPGASCLATTPKPTKATVTKPTSHTTSTSTTSKPTSHSTTVTTAKPAPPVTSTGRAAAQAPARAPSKQPAEAAPGKAAPAAAKAAPAPVAARAPARAGSSTSRPSTAPCTKGSVTVVPSSTTSKTSAITSKPTTTTSATTNTSKPTTFASTVKTSLQRAPAPAAPLARTNPRLTRSVTTIAPPQRPRVPGRRNAAGLLITATPRAPRPPQARARPYTAPHAAPHAAPAAPAAESPKQQRISLVARQAKFAEQNQNPARRAGAQGGRGRGGGGEQGEATCPHGSANSLSSSSSARSWADCVRGVAGQEAPLPALHCSAEDLAGRAGRRGEADSEGWCTVRRARARASPGQQRRTGYSAASRFKIPSSAMSMPSLAMECVVGEASPPAARPVLEKSRSSASMVQGREGREGATLPFLDQLEERAGHSEESLTDPQDIKKKKDELNTSKQLAMRSTSSEGEEGKCRLEKSSSCPLTTEVVQVHRAEVEVEMKVEAVEVVVDPVDEERDRAIAIAELEVSDLQREITETEQAELTDTDCDIDCGTDTDAYTTDTDTADTRSEAGAASDISSRYEALLEGLSWAEQLELEEQLGDPMALEARLPGRAIQLHEKLSSPARKKEPHETFLHHQEKQARARARRMRFTEEKASRLAVLNTRIEEAMEQRDRLVDERKDIIDVKLKRAEENRIQHIEGIRKKAHEEEEKLKEIAFINSLQAQNTRMDMISMVESADEKCEERLAEIAGERAKKAEQRRRGAEEAEERRRAIEESRQRQIDLMISRRREREERMAEVQAVAREQRKVSAAIKDKERLERLSTVRAAEKDMKEELQEKIQLKQEEAAKRHAEYLEQIQQRAWELSLQKCSSDQGVPVIKPYTVKKKCRVCSVLIASEVHLLSHLRGRQHQAALGKELTEEERTAANLRNIVDAAEGEADPRQQAARERVKVAKKKAKKLKVRMTAKAAEWEARLAPPNKHLDSPNRAKIGKSLKEVEKLLASQGKGAWPNNSVSSLERALGEMVRSLDKGDARDQDVFMALGGFHTVWKVYGMLAEATRGEATCVIPLKSLVTAGRVVQRAAASHVANTAALLMSNRLALVADVLLARLARLEEPQEELAGLGPDTDPLAASLMLLLSSTIQQAAAAREPEVAARLQDLVAYIVCSGTVDSLAGYFQLVRDPIDSSPEVADFLLTSLQLLTSLVAAVEAGGEGGGGGGGGGKKEEGSHLLAALQGTELAGTVSMLYGMLLHQGRDSDRSESPTGLPEHTLAVVTATCTLLHRLVGRGDRLALIQAVLGQEGISLEFRHIASYLLYYCQHHTHSRDLLNQVIVLVGYFTANHPDNQAIVQSGSQPSVLQQLASLPFQFFSQPELKMVLFPSLLSSCHGCPGNTAILAQEMSWQLIDDFVRSEEGRASRLVAIVLGGQGPRVQPQT